MGERFNEFCEQTKKRLMGMPSHVVADGVTFVSTEFEAARQAAREHRPPDTSGILAEVATEGARVPYLEIYDEKGDVEVGYVMESMLVYLTARELNQDPEVIDKVQANMRAAGET